MGVYLARNGVNVDRVNAGGRAAAAGWQEGDKIISIDGVKVSNQREVVRELRAGGPLKLFVLERNGKEIETTLDYTDDPDEPARARKRGR